LKPTMQGGRFEVRERCRVLIRERVGASSTRTFIGYLEPSTKTRKGGTSVPENLENR
jgi:hypothetical protein